MVEAGPSITTFLAEGETSSFRRTQSWRSASAAELRYPCPLRRPEKYDEAGVHPVCSVRNYHLLYTRRMRTDCRVSTFPASVQTPGDIRCYRHATPAAHSKLLRRVYSARRR